MTRRLVVAVVLAAAACAAAAVPAAAAGARDGDAALFVLLVGAAAVCVEASGRVPEPAGMNANDMLAAWCVPVAVLLPPFWSLLAPVPLMALTQWRVRRIHAYKRVYSAAAIGLSHAAASAAFHALPGHWASAGGERAVLAVAGAAVLAKALNAVLVGAAVKTVDPEASWRGVLIVGNGRLETAEVCAGVLTAAAVAASPLLAVVALPPVLLLQRGALYAQLHTASRTDAKTGLLNAAAWEREAAAALHDARRRRLPAAVLLVDIDHFKRVNDTHGHLAGDAVLRSVAGALRGQLRDPDLLCRFGGEEFAAFLPGMDDGEAARAAERLRKAVAAAVTPADGALVQVTVSVGVSAADPLASVPPAVAELLAAADAGLYQAKRDGRDRVGAIAAPDRRNGGT